MKLERRVECENLTPGGGLMSYWWPLHVSQILSRRSEQMDIGLMGSRARWLRTGAATTMPKTPHMYPAHQYMKITRSMQAGRQSYNFNLCYYATYYWNVNLSILLCHIFLCMLKILHTFDIIACWVWDIVLLWFRRFYGSIWTNCRD